MKQGELLLCGGREARPELRAVSLAFALNWHQLHHRHSDKPPCGHRWSVGLFVADECLGVATAGRPVARGYDGTRVVEVTRCTTLGARNACSRLYAAIAREAKQRGFRAVITYTRTDESGVSLKAAGFELVKERKRARQWTCPARPRDEDSHAVGRKTWMRRLRDGELFAAAAVSLRPDAVRLHELMWREAGGDQVELFSCAAKQVVISTGMLACEARCSPYTIRRLIDALLKAGKISFVRRETAGPRFTVLPP